MNIQYLSLSLPDNHETDNGNPKTRLEQKSGELAETFISITDGSAEESDRLNWIQECLVKEIHAHVR